VDRGPGLVRRPCCEHALGARLPSGRPSDRGCSARGGRPPHHDGSHCQHSQVHGHLHVRTQPGAALDFKNPTLRKLRLDPSLRARRHTNVSTSALQTGREGQVRSPVLASCTLLQPHAATDPGSRRRSAAFAPISPRVRRHSVHSAPLPDTYTMPSHGVTPVRIRYALPPSSGVDAGFCVFCDRLEAPLSAPLQPACNRT